MTTSTKLVELLYQLEAQLQKHELWQQTMPSPEALQSVEPFAIDTLDPHEWLQWIFIARMHALVESSQPCQEVSLLNLILQKRGSKSRSTQSF